MVRINLIQRFILHIFYIKCTIYVFIKKLNNRVFVLFLYSFILTKVSGVARGILETLEKKIIILKKQNSNFLAYVTDGVL